MGNLRQAGTSKASSGMGPRAPLARRPALSCLPSPFDLSASSSASSTAVTAPASSPAPIEVDRRGLETAALSHTFDTTTASWLFKLHDQYRLSTEREKTTSLETTAGCCCENKDAATKRSFSSSTTSLHSSHSPHSPSPRRRARTASTPSSSALSLSACVPYGLVRGEARLGTVGFKETLAVPQDLKSEDMRDLLCLLTR
ncbi:hypothetical protein DFH09DRAFT_1356472 [Mycena vulgaris]|nr:hypothetical protein DFH09DRAFT_1356472 [Mycena vulgaris]